MEANHYIFACALVIGVIFLAAVVSRKEKPKPTTAKKDPRWKRFRIYHERIHGVGPEGRTAVSEVPGGLGLVVLPQHGLPQSTLCLTVEKGANKIEITRGWFFRRRFRVRVRGKHFLEVEAYGRGATAVHLRSPAAAERYSVQGNVRDREFEVRRANRLAAAVSWQSEGSKVSPRGEYFVEVLRGEDPLALLGIVVAIEMAVGPVTEY
jgi:uncharacterized protein YxjI